jgi:hypothetical protein
METTHSAAGARQRTIALPPTFLSPVRRGGLAWPLQGSFFVTLCHHVCSSNNRCKIALELVHYREIQKII